MAFPIVVPRLGWSMEEGTFVRWLKRDGDTVRRGEVLFELEGDKAIQEVEALDDGILRIPLDAPQPGSDVLVGTVLGYLIAEGEPLPVLNEMAAYEATIAGKATLHAIEVQSGGEITSPVDAKSSRSAATARLKISPRAKRIAKEQGIDWTQLTGSGAGGRIRECDVRAAAQSR